MWGLPDMTVADQHMTESDAVGAILFIYWIMAGLWLFFIKDQEGGL